MKRSKDGRHEDDDLSQQDMNSLRRLLKLREHTLQRLIAMNAMPLNISNQKKLIVEVQEYIKKKKTAGTSKSRKPDESDGMAQCV